MSDKLVSLVALYVTQKAQGENVDEAQIFKAEKRLEHEVEEEIVPSASKKSMMRLDGARMSERRLVCSMSFGESCFSA